MKPISHRVWSIGGPAFGAAWILAPTAAFAATDPAAWQIALVAVAIPVFAALFLYGRTVSTRPRPRWSRSETSPAAP
jgi:hypothetical protein